MSKRNLQRTSEVILFAGDEFELLIPVNNEDGTAIDLTAGSISDVEFNLYADIGGGAAVLTKAGTLDGSVTNGRLQFSFDSTDTSALTPKTYLYQISFQFDGDQLMAGRDLFTIKRRV
jgi:hypothetical protein